MPVGTTKNYYEILGVSKDASQDEIRKAYLRLAKQYHPDKTGGDKPAEQKLKEINEAYDTLKKPDKRKEYDQYLEGGASYGAGPFGAGASRGAQGFGGGSTFGESPFGGFGGAEGFQFEGDFSDLFSNIFGGMGGRTQAAPQQGKDLEAEASVTLREAARGTKRSLRMPSAVRCRSCQGSGAAKGSQPQTCPRCGGSGRVTDRRSSAFVMAQTCPQCHGRGQHIENPCPECHGQGTKVESRTVEVTIPAGVRNGTRLRLAGQGEPGERGGPNGDLFVVIRVQADELFTPQGSDVVCEAPITFTQAVKGCTIEVPTLYGKARLKIPAGTQPGTTMRLRGQGLPAMGSSRKGDQLVKVQVEVPAQLNDEQQKALDAFEEATPAGAYPKIRAFQAKTRKGS